MSTAYELPIFNAYKPKKLVQLSRKLEAGDSIPEPSEERIEQSLKKLQSGLEIRRKDMKVLCYRLDEVERRGLLEKFISVAKEFFGKTERVYYQLKALLLSYYRLYKSHDIFILLKYGVDNNVQWKDDMNYIKSIIEKSEDLKHFFLNIWEEISACRTEEELCNKFDLLMLKKDSPMLQLVLKRKLMTEIDKTFINSDLSFLMIILREYISQNEHKEVFDRFLISRKDSNLDHLDKETEIWFQFIGDTLGDPYGKLKTKWIGISEEGKKTFQRWKALKNIKYFFSEITGDPRRLKFWKQYADKFYRVEFFEKYDKVLLMETNDYLFVEFAKLGAMYVYKREIADINSLEQKFSKHSKTHVVTYVLKNPNLCSERMVHTGDWEYKFKYVFFNKGFIN
jgi:hypothetical protein